jgi:hypothetical protein
MWCCRRRGGGEADPADEGLRGAASNDVTGLEREADRMGAQAASG